ncbi:MAG: sensor histidine kinase, partial [Chloroflexi bacterium]|nr:sensor histidine kinase [Chloroflexota bacterium]
MTIPRQTSMTVYLIVSHMLTFAVALLIYEQVYRALWVALALAAALGMAAALYLRRDLELAETALKNLNDGQSVPAALNGRWPLKPLLAQINTLLARERDTGALREQLVQQVGTTAAQEERNRLARDLHDSIKQQIFSISVSAAAVQARWEHDVEGAKSALNDVRRSAQEAMVEMRALLQQLGPAPLEKVGLVQALRDQCEALGYRTGAQVTCDVGGLPDDERLPLGAQESVFRIAQEALGNVARHARAEKVAVRLKVLEKGDAAAQPGGAPLAQVAQVLLEVCDDGQGFDAQSAGAGMGLNNMRARAARLGGVLDLQSAPGQGTTLRVRIPLTQPGLFVVSDRLSAAAQRRLNRAIAARWTGALLSIFVLALITRQGRFGHLLGMSSETIAVVFQVLAALLVAAVAGAFIYAWQTIKPLIVNAGSSSTVTYKYRYHVHRSLSVVFGASIVFLPTLPLYSGEEIGAWVALLMTGLLGVPLVYELVNVYSVYHRYLRSLPLAELRQEIEHKWKQTLSNWFTIGALLFITLALSYNRIRSVFTVDGWLTALADLTVVSILISHAGETWYYRRGRPR